MQLLLVGNDQSANLTGEADEFRTERLAVAGGADDLALVFNPRHGNFRKSHRGGQASHYEIEQGFDVEVVNSGPALDVEQARKLFHAFAQFGLRLAVRNARFTKGEYRAGEIAQQAAVLLCQVPDFR